MNLAKQTCCSKTNFWLSPISTQAHIQKTFSHHIPLLTKNKNSKTPFPPKATYICKWNICARISTRTTTTKQQNDTVSFPCQLHLQALWCLSCLLTNMYSERSLDIQTLLREIKRHLAHGGKNTTSVSKRERDAARRKREVVIKKVKMGEKRGRLWNNESEEVRNDKVSTRQSEV